MCPVGCTERIIHVNIAKFGKLFRKLRIIFGFFFVVSKIFEQEYIPLHSSSFEIDEEVLKIGAAFFAKVAREAVRSL